MFTRQDYMRSRGGMAAHRKYYAQFVTPAVVRFVVGIIGAADLKASRDEHLNDILLHRWDRLEPSIRGRCLSRMGDVNGRTTDAQGRRSIAWSLSDAVCIAKEAARQWLESQDRGATERASDREARTGEAWRLDGARKGM